MSSSIRQKPYDFQNSEVKRDGLYRTRQKRLLEAVPKQVKLRIEPSVTEKTVHEER